MEEFARKLIEDEDGLPYHPYSDPGTDIALATLQALVKRFGVDFAHEVREAMLGNAERMRQSGDERARADADTVIATAGMPFWRRLGVVIPTDPATD